MRANRGRDTGPERKIREGLRAAGLSGYRLNWKHAPGRPDIAYPGRRTAIFVHGCFWHRHVVCQPPQPKTHSEFWARKFELNVERDARKRAQLEEAGWLVIEVWECDIRGRLPEVLRELAARVEAQPRVPIPRPKPAPRTATAAARRRTSGSARSTS
ncbi:MAG: very short patch repair endonuclease [Chloroflexota bacterium]